MRSLALIAILFAGCDAVGLHRKADESPSASIHFFTVQHDNHWWIYTRGDARHFVHHPDCPCQKHRRPLLQDGDVQSVD